MIENIFTIIVIISLIYFGTQHKKERRLYKEKLMINPSYSIGEVSFYRSGKSPIIVPKLINSTAKYARVEYSFSINGCLVTNNYDAFDADVPDEGVKKGEKYLVLYIKRQPKRESYDV